MLTSSARRAPPRSSGFSFWRRWLRGCRGRNDGGRTPANQQGQAKGDRQHGDRTQEEQDDECHRARLISPASPTSSTRGPLLRSVPRARGIRSSSGSAALRRAATPPWTPYDSNIPTAGTAYSAVSSPAAASGRRDPDPPVPQVIPERRATHP